MSEFLKYKISDLSSKNDHLNTLYFWVILNRTYRFLDAIASLELGRESN